jgi:hypothetical protein
MSVLTGVLMNNFGVALEADMNKQVSRTEIILQLGLKVPGLY